VHDCTLIDESVDASGEGLVDRGLEEWIGVGSESKANDSQPNSAKASKRKKGTQPGRTVFLLALAALPLFGVGQFMLQDNPGIWFRAKLLLAIYLFSSLSLLVTTSFLNLRRYLRQRDVDMPRDVTVAWLTGGMVLVAALLMVAYIAPMPGQMVAGWSPPTFGNEDQLSSRFGWGEEAAKNASSQQDAGAREDRNPQGKDVLSDSDEGGNGESQSPESKDSRGSSSSKSSGDQQKQGGSGGEPGEKGSSNEQGSQKGGGKSSEQQKGSSGSDGKQQSQSDQNGQSGKSDDSGQSSSNDSQDAQSGQGDSSNSNKNEGANQQSDSESGGKSGSKSESESSGDQSNSSSDSSDENSGQENDERSGQSSQSEQNVGDQRSSSALNGLTNMFSGIASLLKWLMILALVLVVVYYVYMIRDQLMEWWRRLFERDAKPAALQQTTIEPEMRKPPRSFGSYQNPVGRERDPVKVIAVTFQAFEAWCREHGWDRSLEETPTEYVARIRRAMPERFDTKALFEPIESDARSLSLTCDRVAYGKGRVTKRDFEMASRLWQYMQTHTASSVSKSGRTS
ncbi:MAG: DUF4129 domain-containing protein, partial [Planctomycetota bacterium]